MITRVVYLFISLASIFLFYYTSYNSGYDSGYKNGFSKADSIHVQVAEEMKKMNALEWCAAINKATKGLK